MEDYLARGVLTVANGKTKLRTIQTRLMAGEIRDEMEHVEPYGFTSEPHVDAETFSLFFDGDRSHGVVFCVADRRYRLKLLKAGEVALYDDLGQFVLLSRDGIRVNTSKSLEATVGTQAKVQAQQVIVDSPETTITGNLTVKGLITGQGGLAISGGSGARVAGSVSVSGGDVTADGISLKGHTHPGDSGGTTGSAQ